MAHSSLCITLKLTAAFRTNAHPPRVGVTSDNCGAGLSRQLSSHLTPSLKSPARFLNFASQIPQICSLKTLVVTTSWHVGAPAPTWPAVQLWRQLLWWALGPDARDHLDAPRPQPSPGRAHSCQVGTEQTGFSPHRGNSSTEPLASGFTAQSASQRSASASGEAEGGPPGHSSSQGTPPGVRVTATPSLSPTAQGVVNERPAVSGNSFLPGN